MLKRFAVLAPVLSICLLGSMVSSAGADTPNANKYSLEYAGDSVIATIGEPATIKEWNPSQRELNSTSSRLRSFSGQMHSQESRRTGRNVKVLFWTDSKGRIESRAVRHTRSDENGNLRPLQWTAGTKAFHATWPAETGVNWKIYRDGTLLEETADNQFRDTDARNEDHTYRISGLKNVEKNGRTYRSPINYIVTVPAPDDSSIGLLVSDDKVDKVSSNSDISTVPTGHMNVRTVYYSAFINRAYIDAPLLCQAQGDIEYFGGDGRGFAATPYNLGPDRLTSKILAAVGSNWIKPEHGGGTAGFREDIMLKEVGTSYGYDGDRNLIAQENAGTSGVNLTLGENYEAFSVRRVKASVALPLCVGAPAISFEFEYGGSEDGWVSVTGQHDKAPSTEILWESSTNVQDPRQYSRGCWYRFENKGFENLAPPFPNAHFDIDANPEIARPDCPTL